MEIVVDGRVYNLNKGESVIIFPNQIHSIKSEKSAHVLWIFSSELVKAYASKVAGKIPVSNVFVPSKHLTKILLDTYENSSLIEKKGVFYLLCSEFDRVAEYTKRTKDDKNLLYKIFKFVESNYGKDCSLESLSKETGFSYSYISRYFKACFGIGFNQYLSAIRLKNALLLMNEKKHSFTHCALESGFSSMRTFYRVFENEFHCSPRDYLSKSESYNALEKIERNK